MPDAAAIYARISSDQAGDALGVARQLADCRAEAQRRGWTVAEEYVDNDLSAYSDKARPAYQKLLDDITAGRRDAVIVYHLDRLHRRPKELEEFVEACDRAGMKHLASLQGEVNIGSGDGLLVARIMAAVAANESASKSRRVQRKRLENAQHGKPHGGGTRPFGYEQDMRTVRADEAAIIRDLAERLLAGESLGSLARWLNDQGVATVSGTAQWRPGSVRTMLYRARLSGQREHRGEIIGPADWPAILDPAQTRRIRALLDDPYRKTTRTVRRYLLAGLLRCHACGHAMFSRPRDGVRRYVCRHEAGWDGCGRTYIVAEPLEALLTEAVLQRLDTPDLARAASGKPDTDDEADRLRDAIGADQEQLDELAGLYAARAITAPEWLAARDPIEGRLTAARRTLARLTDSTALDGWLGNSSALRGQWNQLNLTRQAAIVKAVLDHAVIGPGRNRGAAFDIDRVTPVWRL